ncbi:MAG: hypothetical protein HC838_14805 [Spirulinaceae cyanobacterium RM2_2_10]|nr:hypothetical protein [Spirulinaceae cyanobacterium SM2_1_0]NJO21047.1 hypothetical protein [Spirulinaceae cyanobacterium RM2_2_10]
MASSPAAAQPEVARGTDANYIGVGVSAGLTNGGQGDDAAILGGNVQGRATLPDVPVSVRGAVIFSDETSAIMPLATYDIPIAPGANVYVGGGYSFVEDAGQRTPLGNRNAPVVVVGAEAELGANVVAYGDAKWGINAYQNSPADALSVQGGVGLRFR